MASNDAILCMGEARAHQIATLGATTASTAVAIGKNVKFIITSDSSFTIGFGLSTANGGPGVTTPTAADLQIPANTVIVFDTGSQFDSFNVFNPNASTSNLWYQRLTIF